MIKKPNSQPRLGELGLGENDLAPILITPKLQESMASVTGGTRTVKKLVDDDDEAKSSADTLCGEPQAEEEAPPDPFLPVIQKMAKGESPAVREAIQGTACFARMWYSDEDESFCPETECQVRKLCEAAYHKAVGSVEAEIEAEAEASEYHADAVGNITEVVGRAQEAVLEGDSLNKVNLQRSMKKHKKVKVKKILIKSLKQRLPYLDRGMPVDTYVSAFWKAMGQPPELPPDWAYQAVASLEQRCFAAKWFSQRYGKGLVVSRRVSYWQFFYDGMHCGRFWVNSARAGWLDCNLWLAQELREQGFPLEPVATKDPKHSYKFYEYKVKIKSVEVAKDIAKVLLSILKRMEVR